MSYVPVFPIIPLEYAESLSYMEWLIRLTKNQNEMAKLLSGKIDVAIEEYIDNRFDNLMLNAIYDEKTETIFLKKEIGRAHV